MKNRLLTVILLLGCLSSAQGLGAAFETRGQVVKVIPVKETTERLVMDQPCVAARPEEGSDLGSVLRWDLRVECQQRKEVRETITAYKVYYRWDGRTYDVLMPEPPGKTIPVRVNID
ncbi:MAG: hypothetical protein O3A63_19880 [Proteobacteria bacterium]|nr:hypothetical protein [Pseudomonadota bacterium]